MDRDGAPTVTAKRAFQRCAGVGVWVCISLDVLGAGGVCDGLHFEVSRHSSSEDSDPILASCGNPQLCINALPLLFLHEEQWQRYRVPGSDVMVNCTARQRQEPVVEKVELDDAIGVDAVLDMGPLGTKSPRAIIYLKYIGLVVLGAWLQ